MTSPTTSVTPYEAGREIDWPGLRRAATAAMHNAYAPYSDYPVGAAGLVDDGRVVVGCNVENASYGLGTCAECGMVAALHASGGGRLVAVACVDSEGLPLAPCGRCRQLLWEHGGPECLVDLAVGQRPMAELLPFAFDADDLRTAVPGGSVAVPAALARYTGTGTVVVHPDVLAGTQVWTAYWERSSGAAGESTRIIEEAPTWPDAAVAVRWGRARSTRVIVIDANGAAAWAGSGERPAEFERDWP